jgi:hypothetical protein
MLYGILRRRYPWIAIKHGETLLITVSIAILSHFYFEDKQLFRNIYQKAIDFVLKDV